MYSILEIYLIYLIHFRWDWCSTRVYFTTAVRELMKIQVLTKIGEAQMLQKQWRIRDISPIKTLFKHDFLSRHCRQCLLLLFSCKKPSREKCPSISPKVCFPLPSRLFHLSPINVSFSTSFASLTDSHRTKFFNCQKFCSEKLRKNSRKCSGKWKIISVVYYI